MTRRDPSEARDDGPTARGKRCEPLDCSGEALPRTELERYRARPERF